MSSLYSITQVKTCLPKPSKKSEHTLLVLSSNKCHDGAGRRGSYLRKGSEGLKCHFKSVTYYSLMIALTELAQGEQLLRKLCKERSFPDSFLRLKLEFSF